jgi:hypothetical protein
MPFLFAIMPRATREFMILQFTMMAQQAGLDPAGNFGYRKIKEFDDQITTLRASLL